MQCAYVRKVDVGELICGIGEEVEESWKERDGNVADPAKRESEVSGARL
jgi:hypothetical protein